MKPHVRQVGPNIHQPYEYGAFHPKPYQNLPDRNSFQVTHPLNHQPLQSFNYLHVSYSSVGSRDQQISSKNHPTDDPTTGGRRCGVKLSHPYTDSYNPIECNDDDFDDYDYYSIDSDPSHIYDEYLDCSQPTSDSNLISYRRKRGIRNFKNHPSSAKVKKLKKMQKKRQQKSPPRKNLALKSKIGPKT